MVRSATRPAVTTALMAVVSAIIVLPYAAYLLINDLPSVTGWLFILATIVLHIWYFATLGYAYNTGELSIVYPVARGLGLAIIPVLGILVIGETMSWPAVLGAISIVSGIGLIAISDVGTTNVRRVIAYVPDFAILKRILKKTRLRIPRSWILAMSTGLVIGIYTVVDAQGVQHVRPVVYMFFLQLGGGLGMMVIQSRIESRAAFIDESKRHWKILVTGGLLQFLAYTLVLTALTFSPVSYVGPFREISILIAVVYGAMVLKEKVTARRAQGAILIALGGIAIALAP